MALGCLRREWKRLVSTQATGSGRALIYESCGQPEEVLKLRSSWEEDGQLGADQLRLSFLCAPINPSDINAIQGTYPIKPPLPAVAGNEGVAEVLEVGNQVKNVSVGDWVVPLAGGQGTWRETGVFESRLWHKVSNTLPIECAATMAISPPTAFCLLHDFCDLKRGDVIVQNGATSAVGLAVIQLAKGMGVHTVNIVRDRPDFEETESWLMSLGATMVTMESDVKARFGFSELPKGALGLNCIGGRSAVSVAKLLRFESSPMNNVYFEGGFHKGSFTAGSKGGLSCSPTTDSVLEKKAAVIDQVASTSLKGNLRIRTETFPIQSYIPALERSKHHHRQVKILLNPRSGR